jgi:ariadne-1
MSDYEEPDYDDIDIESEGNQNEIEQFTHDLILTKRKSIVFVTLDDIRSLIAKKCEDIKELTGLGSDDALILYNFFQWRKDLLESKWFEDSEKIRIEAGLDPISVAHKPQTQTLMCPMCMETKHINQFDSLSCNHLLCVDCIEDYITFNVTKPEKGYFWKCPTQDCNLIFPDSFNQKYLKSELRNQYFKKMAIAYADNSKSLRWCPGTDCHFGCEAESIVARTVTCNCGWVYCFRCGLEDHLPCDCDMSKEWMKKDETGGANAKWLLINTKDCPKCKKAIEKNQGCNYMRCRHPGCQFEFCWLCLADWKTHNDHFKCNKYDNLSKEEKKKMDDEINSERSNLQKYAFYYERYYNNEIAIRSVAKLIKGIQEEQKDLAIDLVLSLTQLEFLIEACHVLRNSKRILKWSYAYGFYLENPLQRNLYEIIQENIDIYSGELHVLLEKTYEHAKKNIGDFTKFKDKVLGTMYKCRQSSTAFLEKMEEFENEQLENQLTKEPSLKSQFSTDSDSKDKTKKKGFFAKILK